MFPLASNTRRLALRWHGRLGLLFAPLILLWCASGAVMLFVPFPDLSETERRAGLPPLAPTSDELLDGERSAWPEALARSASLQVERLGPRLVLRTLENEVFDATTGAAMAPLDLGLLDDVARYSRDARVQRAGWIEIDQWTVSGRFHRHRPLRRVEFDDSAGTHVYVSSRTGEVVQRTRAHERRWNQVGAIAHWIYWTSLRRHQGPWSATVIALSTLTTAVLLVGLLLGLRRDRHRSAARRRHRLLGWTAGSLLIVWSASGLVSMNPFGFLASITAPWHPALPIGAPPSCSPSPPLELRSALQAALRLPDAQGARFIRVGSLGGTPAAWIDGARPPRRDTRGEPAPLEQDAVRRAAAACETPPMVSFALVDASDPYRTGAGSRLRARYSDPAATWVDFDGETGEVVRRLDRNDRLERWLHRGLHTLDVLGPLRTGSVGRTLVAILLVAGSVVVISGLALRRNRSGGDSAH